MAKGYDTHRERLDLIQSFGKNLAKRAGFRCEWCEGKDDLRPWDGMPDRVPAEETLALLCGRCREFACGKSADERELRSIRNALWSPVPAVAEGAARVLVQHRVPWARDAIEESFIDEAVKEKLLS
jgi:hypothetical protein